MTTAPATLRQRVEEMRLRLRCIAAGGLLLVAAAVTLAWLWSPWWLVIAAPSIGAMVASRFVLHRLLDTRANLESSLQLQRSQHQAASAQQRARQVMFR